MRTLANHIYDISNNSIKADSTEVILDLIIIKNEMIFKIKDNGKGIEPEFLSKIFSPFVTGRDKRIRKVGMGLPLLKQNTEITGGYVKIDSEIGVGTKLEAKFIITNIDMVPIGNLAGNLVGIITANENINWDINIKKDNLNDSISTKEIKEALGNDISLGNIKVIPVLKELFENMLKDINFVY